MDSSKFAGRISGARALLQAGLFSLAACGGGGGGSSGNSVATLAVNHAPTIAGTPPSTIDTGSTFDFQPLSGDVDGNRLSFTITNKPAWASFSSSTGQLTGTPGVSDLGNSGDIVISVSDGTSMASLPAFQIKITGTAILSWSAPLQNVDGTVLRDLTGYRIYYGSSVATMVAVAIVTDPAQQSYRLGGLMAGTWYFAVSAVNSEGTESGLSNIGSKTI